MKKAELRKIYLIRQRNMSENEVNEKSKIICENFFAEINLSEIRFLHIFLPIRKNNEINAWLLIHQIQQDFPEIKIVIPVADLSDYSMKHFVFKDKNQLHENRWGISEPRYGEIISPEMIDLVVVPLLCFDEKKNRIGYGKGYYDRFLAACRQETQKIGLSYFAPVPEIEDANEWDIQLDKVITAS